MAAVLQPKLVPIHLIDPPDIAMRSKMDDGKLQSLAADIERNGLTNAICIRSRGGRFYIIAGHRRYEAFKILRRAEIDAKDYTGSPLSDEAVKFGENFYREDVNDADMSDYLHDLREQQGMDLEQLMAITGQSEDWIAKRLSLFRGDKAVLDALRDEKIRLGHALLLNKFPERYRAQYLETVINSTPPVRVVEGWLREFNAMGLPTEPLEAGQQQQQAATVLPGAGVDPCGLCNEAHSPWDMEFIKVHKGCLRSILKALAGETPADT